MPIKPTLTNVDQLQHNAVSRLTLHVAAATMDNFAKLQQWLINRVNAAADEEGNVDPAKLSGVIPVIEGRWKAAMNEYTSLLTRARVQAADIAYTPLRLRHNAYITEAVTQEAENPTQTIAEMWIRRRNFALQVAQRRSYSDGLVLSQRIWRLENDGLSRIRSTLAAGMDGHTSAVRLSRQLESLLGANQDMPRWAYSRLNKMTATERMNDLTGLLTDPAQRSQGMAYNALRMARTELQYANHAVTSEIAAHSPWITGRYTRLSPAHPRSDQCDTWAAGGPYPKTQQILPLHPNCVTPGQLVITERGSIPIEEVQVGDQVLTHRGRFRPVLAAWGSSCKNQVYRITTEAGTLELTGNHPVLTAGGWINAELVQLGDRIWFIRDRAFWDVSVTGITHVDYSGTVYNMTVAEDESYTVGGHVVHNCLCRYEEALMPPDAFAAQVRGWVRGDNAFLDDYSDWLGTRSIMPLPDLGTIAEVMDLWINGSVDAQAEALQL